MRGHIQHWQFLLCKIIGVARAPWAPPPFLRPCYRIREIINGIKVFSNWKGDIDRSQIFGPASLNGRDNSKEIFINSNIILVSGNTYIKSILTNYSLHQLINDPTSITETSATLTDVIITNNTNNIAYSKVCVPFLDVKVRYHCPVMCLIRSEKTNDIPNYFFCGSRLGQILHARLRMHCSLLKQHLYLKNIKPDPHCICGGVETTYISCLIVRIMNGLDVSTLTPWI